MLCSPQPVKLTGHYVTGVGSACVAVLFDDALGDLQDGLFVLGRGLAEESFGLLAGAVLGADEHAGGQRDLGLVVAVALGLFDDGASGSELG